jgi:hypothetical protein
VAEEITLVFKPNPTTLDTLTVDATLTATHSLRADVTEHPLDEGGSAADSIIKKVPEFRLEGIVSARQADGRSRDAWAKLKALMGKPIKVVTALEQYDNVVMSSLEARQDRSAGGVVPFSATFRAIRFVKAQTVELIDVADTRAKKPGDKGSQPGKKASAAVANRSVFKQGIESKTTKDAVASVKKTFNKTKASLLGL